MVDVAVSQPDRPARAYFDDVAFGEGAGIQKVVGQPFGPRCSRMMSVNEGPSVVRKISWTSSRVTPGMIRLFMSELNSTRCPASLSTSRADGGLPAAGAAGVAGEADSAAVGAE